MACWGQNNDILRKIFKATNKNDKYNNIVDKPKDWSKNVSQVSNGNGTICTVSLSMCLKLGKNICGLHDDKDKLKRTD